jgi:hypothetical protein
MKVRIEHEGKVFQGDIPEIIATTTTTTTTTTTPVVTTTTTNTALKLVSTTVPATWDIEGGTKKTVEWKLSGGSGEYGFKSGGFVGTGTMMWMPKNSVWTVQAFDKTDPSKTIDVTIDSEKVGTINFNGTVGTVVPEVVITVPTVTVPVVTQTQTQTGTRPLIGAVRWDWWANNFECTTLWLSPKEYHYKAPFFAKEIGANSLSIDGNTQEIFDKELAYANYAGIDYFAFDWYEGYNDPAGINGSYGMELFKRSTNKGNMKMAYILESTSLGFSGEFSARTLKDICADFGRDDYQKINGRPLFFYMTYPPLTTNQVDLINKTYLSIHPGKPLPYIVNAIQVGEEEAKMNNGTGIAAWSQYTGYSKEGDLKMRERYKAAGVKLIPTMTVGWDTRPIAQNPCGWYKNAPYETEYRLTGEALKNHLVDTINFVKANPTTCEANTILCYAWNENAEGGYIVPTITPGSTNINVDAVEIFHSVLRPGELEQ